MNAHLLKAVFPVVLLQLAAAPPPESCGWGAAPNAALTLSVVDAETRLALGCAAPFHRTPNQVANARLVPVENSPILIACWEETAASGRRRAIYAISLDGQTMATVRATSYALKLRQQEFDPVVRAPALPDELVADASGHIYIVQFVAQPLPEFRAAIEARGGTLYKFLPNHAYVVKMTPEVRDAVGALPFVRWVGPYHPAYRIEASLREQSRIASLRPERFNIQVFEAGDDQKNAVAQRIEALGGVVDVRNAGKYLLRATLTPSQAVTVAHWDEVAFIDHWAPVELAMDKFRLVGGVDYVEQVAGFDGAGVRGEVLDVGFNYQHVDFASRPLIQHTPSPGISRRLLLGDNLWRWHRRPGCARHMPGRPGHYRRLVCIRVRLALRLHGRAASRTVLRRLSKLQLRHWPDIRVHHHFSRDRHNNLRSGYCAPSGASQCRQCSVHGGGLGQEHHLLRRRTALRHVGPGSTTEWDH
jgi:hypothetical protein